MTYFIKCGMQLCFHHLVNGLFIICQLIYKEVRQLEPNLTASFCGGVFYPDTRYTMSPINLSRRYNAHLQQHGGMMIHEQVFKITPHPTSVSIQTSSQELLFDHLVIAAGVASKELLVTLGVNFPLVSERGYHLEISSGDKPLNRPIGWLGKGLFLTPMTGGIRVAGTAEFAHADAPFSEEKARQLFNYAKIMLGDKLSIESKWVGSRPSTPDSLPIIGPLKKYPNITLALGHGHLGLTFAGVTGQLIAEQVNEKRDGEKNTADLSILSPSRFNL